MSALYKESVINQIRDKYLSVVFCLNERGRRIWAATEAKSLGRGGISAVMKATRMSSSTVNNGLKELENLEKVDKSRLRKTGGGRKSLKNTGIVKALDLLVEPTSRGDPESSLRWTSKSVRNLAEELQTKGYEVSFRSVSTILKDLGYSLQSNKKMNEGSSHVDRDAQFRYINQTVEQAIEDGNPSISVDTKKKELIGNFKNHGIRYEPKGKLTRVNTHDFPDKNLGKVAPYGIYDIGQNAGWVSVGVSSDTAEFAVNSIRTWWYKMGKLFYSKSKELVITADCGGSNGYRVKLWKYELQKFANEIGLMIKVRHFQPGTSKWNKIEHRLFSYISKNWRGEPLITKETVVNLIGSTKTKGGLKVMSVLDENNYEKGITISEEDFAKIHIKGDEFHPEWNYTILPQIV
jgi:transposase